MSAYQDPAREPEREYDDGDAMDRAYEVLRYEEPFAPVTAERIRAVPDWYWEQNPTDLQRVMLGDAKHLARIEAQVVNWVADNRQVAG
jgi:hypothetical protein